MLRKISLAVGLVAVLSLTVAGCGPAAPTVPHQTGGLEPVDCLACHELGLEGAAKIPDKHLDDEGEVRYDDCRCHKPAPVEEQTTSDQGAQMSGAIGMGGLAVGSVGLAAIGLFVVSSRKRGHLDG
jgi:hypothetical protein